MLFPDIRNVPDLSGDFLKNINSPFGLSSPIQPSRHEEKPLNNYQHNLNLTLELQKLVDEHRMMEEYPIQGDLEMMIEGDQEPLPLDMPKMDFIGDAEIEAAGLFGD